jgi:CIC family chloride channel protein
MLKTVHFIFRSFVLWTQKKLSPRQFFIVASAVVGLSSGGAAIALKYVVHSIELFVENTSIGAGTFMIAAAFPLLGLLLTVAFIQFFLGGRFKKGSAETAYAMLKNRASSQRQTCIRTWQRH